MSEHAPEIYTIREDFIRRLGGYEALTEPNGDEDAYIGRSIRTDKIDEVADAFVCLIADVIASLIDAGSEREAVEENDILRAAIADELKGWTKP